jgi:two-component system OmpR family sensor kinase
VTAPQKRTAARRSLRQRLTLALVGLSVGSVLLAGFITVVAARPATRSAATSELRRTLGALAEEVRDVERPRLVVAQLKNRLLANQVAVITIRNRRGNLARITNLPNGVRPADLDPESLAVGRVQSGSRGAIVWVAQPLNSTPEGTLVLVATRRIGVFAVGRLGGILLVAAVAAAAVAVAVSLWLVRRLTRPLQAMERTARAIAGGDLDARVGLPGTDVDDELAAVGRAIDTMAAELSRHRSLERAFLMSISHDLRTPLTSIRGYAEAVAEGAADDEASRRRAAVIIEAEARRLERLVADLLELARLDAREFSLHPGPVDAGEVARHAALALQPAAQEAGVRLVVGEVDGREPAAVAMADPERLAQVVANLVENALKYAATTVEVGYRERRRRRWARHRPRRPAPGLRAALHLAPPARPERRDRPGPGHRPGTGDGDGRAGRRRPHRRGRHPLRGRPPGGYRRGRVDVVAYDGGRVEAVDDVDFGFVELVEPPGGRVVVVAVVVVVSSGS